MSSLAFKSATRRNRIPLQDVAFTAQGQFQRIDLPQVGYLAYLDIYCFGNIVVGAGNAGTWDANYWPYNLLRSIVLRSNEGFELYRTTGYQNMLVQYTIHRTFVPALIAQPITFGNGTSGARVACSQYPTGAVGAATVYFGVHYKIPIAASPNLATGLVLLQNQATRAQLELQLGQATDWGITGGFTSVAVTCRSSMTFFSVPADPNAQPDTSFVHRWINEEVPWTTSGDQQYKVPVNGVISRVLSSWRDGVTAAPAAFFSTASRPDLPNIGNVTVQYAASMKPEIEDFRIMLERSRLEYGRDYPDGVLPWEFSLGGGSPELGFDGRDVYDTSQLTEFALVTNWSGAAPGAGSTINYTREELQRRVA